MQPSYLSIPASELSPAHRLAYTDWNSTNPNAVFCVHGLTRNARDFDFLAEALAPHFRVICPDMPGRGMSDYLTDPTHYNYATYLADIGALLASLQLPRVHWVGTSMGGILGMMMANTAPGVIRSLALNDVGCLIPAAGLKRILNYAGVPLAFKNRAEAEAMMRDNYKPFGIREEAHWQHLFAHGVVEENGSYRLSYDPRMISAFPAPEKVEDINLWHLWEKISDLPLLLIRGERSDILTPETARDMQAKHQSLAYREIAGAGHAPALFSSEETQIIRDWLLRADG